jgi:MFS family permease
VEEAREAQEQPATPSDAGLSSNARALGVVSLFTDLAGEMVTPLRAIFLANVLLAPIPIVGLIEGIAASTASLLKVASNRVPWSATARKPLMLLGYGLSTVARPSLALVATWQLALGIIVLDRAGRGLRSSPRDSLLSEATPRPLLGKVFDLHRALNMAGAMLGPLLAALILAYGGDLRTVFAWTALPGLAAMFVLLLFVRERARASVEPVASEVGTVGAGALGARFWMFTVIATVFALGASSEAFLFLRTVGLGEGLVGVALVYFAFSVVYAVLSGRVRTLSERWGRLPLLVAGYAAFGVVYAGWSVATQTWNAWVLFVAYGVYVAATDGVARSFVPDLVAREQRGAALRWFTGLTGLAALPANVLAGWLWSAVGPQAVFQWGAFMGIVSVALLAAWMPWLRRGYAR